MNCIIEHLNLQLCWGKWDPRAIRTWNGNLINQNYLDNALGPLQNSLLFPCQALHPRKTEGGMISGSFPHQELQPVEFCSQNLGIGVHRWQGGEGIIIQLGWGWSVSSKLGRTRWPQRGGEGKPQCSFSQTCPAWDLLPKSTLFPLPSLNVDTFHAGT